MTELEEMSEGLNRLVKIALDTGEASSIEEAQRIFGEYRMQILVGADVANKVVLQAALVTAVNCGVRAFLGGVTVVGACGDLNVALHNIPNVAEAILMLGARLSDQLEPEVPTLAIGDVDVAPLEPLALRA